MGVESGQSPATPDQGGKAVAFVARSGHVFDATPAFGAALRGESRGALTHLDELPGDVRQALLAEVGAALSGALAGPGLRITTAQGAWLAHVMATPSGAGAEAMALVVVDRAGEDATGRLRAEDALRESEDRFRQIADNIKEVFFITDHRTFKLLYVNPAFEQVYGRSRQELYDDLSSLSTSIHPEDRARVVAEFNASVDTGTHDATYRVVRPDGSIVWVHDRAYPVRGADGALMASGLVTDITEERKLRLGAAHAQKLESLGRLAGGIAHEFNNILTVVLACTELAASTLPEASPAQAELASVRDAGVRAATLTQQLVALARHQVMDPTLVELSELASSMRPALAQLIGERTTLEVRLAAQGTATVWADRSQIEQVLLNLAVNARDAMPNGGRLTVEISNVTVGPGAAADFEDVPAGEYVRLAVGDEGEGIAPSHREDVFAPFFTTMGRGAGLGLATTHGMVAQAGGRILVRANIGAGAIFDVLFPRAQRAPDGPTAPAEHATIAPVGQETILLVEDQAPIRRAAASILGSEGYRVIAAGDGVEAMRLASEHAGTIHLLLSDVLMPRMGGVELADRLLVLRPETKVLFTSGFTEGADLKLSSGTAFLPKPYVKDTLLAKVRAVLRR